MKGEKVTKKAWAIKFTDPDYPFEFDCRYTGAPRLFQYKYLAQNEIRDYWRPQRVPTKAVRITVVEEASHD